MPVYNVRIYAFDPLGVINNTVGGVTTYNGPATATGTATITDNGAGTRSQFLEDVGSETATATTTINGVSAGSSQVYAEESWTLRDLTTGKEFQVVTFRIVSGTNAGYYTLSEVPLMQGRSYQTLNHDTTPNSATGDAVFSYADYVEADGIVSGTGGNDVIDGDYRGDPGNEIIDDPDSPPRTASQFNWSDYADEQDLRGGVVQNTGGVNVQVSYSDVQTNEIFSVERSGGAEAIYRAAGETFATNSAAYLYSNGSADDSRITFDFAAINGSGFENSVENVRFRISDIDGVSDGTNNFRDIVTVRAYDANGNEIPVKITPGSNMTLSADGNTVTANLVNFAPNNAQASALFEIQGPVSQIVVTYDNGGTTQQAVYISDLQFESVPLGAYDDTVDAGAGNDFVDGGAGNDSIRGGSGNDTIYGGLGNDTVDGGTGNDVIYAGSGDAVSGGDGNDTFLIDASQLNGSPISLTGGEGAETTGDVLNFNGQLLAGSVVITDNDGSGPGKTGTATLLDGTVVNFSQIESIICFAGGTLIDTPHGLRPIDDLSVGDMVLTRDSGPQPLRWIGQRTVSGEGAFAPIQFAPGSIGNTRRLLVSPQHRMLITDYRAAMYYGEEEVITAAEFLLNGDTVVIKPMAEVTYFHLLFDRHELISSDGAWSESYQPGSYSLAGLADKARAELFDLFPSLRWDPNGYGRSARAAIKRHQAALLAA